MPVAACGKLENRGCEIDDFNTLSQRLLSRCPSAGKLLSEQLINDAWKQLQGRREWSWRRSNNIFQPPPLVTAGTVSTNLSNGNPNLITGVGTTFTQSMVGQQIRINGLNFPYYDIVEVLSPTALLIGSPGWTAPDLTNSPYTILQIYYPVPADFGYFYVVVSIKDAYRLWDTVSAADLDLLDPQRAQTGQTYGCAFHDYNAIYSGTVGPTIQIIGTGQTPISGAVSAGYTGPVNYTYTITIAIGGSPGTVTFNWIRSGQSLATTGVATNNTNTPIPLSDGLGVTLTFIPGNYNAGDTFIINATAATVTGSMRYELWPSPSLNTPTVPAYQYPYIYIKREYDLTPQSPALPPLIANRGDLILEMGLAACARFPGPDADHPNPYFNLGLAMAHEARVENLMRDAERNDEEVGVTLVTYKEYPFYPAPWLDGSWQQTHAPFIRG